MEEKTKQEEFIEGCGLILGTILFVASVVMINAAVIMVCFNYLIANVIGANNINYYQSLGFCGCFVLIKLFNEAIVSVTNK